MRGVRQRSRRRPAGTLIALAVLVAVLAAGGLAGTPSGVATAHPRVVQQTMLGLTAPGPDAVWFSEMRAYREARLESWIGRITPAGLVTEFRARLPYPASLGNTPEDPSLSDLTVGPDGRVWFVAGTPWIGRLAPDGGITRFPTRIAGPSGWGSALSIAAGPDGNLWFTTGVSSDRAHHAGGRGHPVPAAPRPGRRRHHERAGRQPLVRPLGPGTERVGRTPREDDDRRRDHGLRPHDAPALRQRSRGPHRRTGRERLVHKEGPDRPDHP